MPASERPGAVQAIEARAEDDPAGTPRSFKGSDGDLGPIVESDHSGQEEPELDDDPFYDSSLNFRDYAASPRRRSWRAMRRLFSSRRFSQAMATAVLLLFISTLDVPWHGWLSSEMQAAREKVGIVMSQDFRFGSSDGTSRHLDPAKHNRFSTRKRRRLRRDRSSPLLAPHGG